MGIVKWIVRWTIRNGNVEREFQEGYEFHFKAIAKQLELEALGIESVIECAR